MNYWNLRSKTEAQNLFKETMAEKFPNLRTKWISTFMKLQNSEIDEPAEIYMETYCNQIVKN